jgi:beta-galactosidase/beta-glucuronidase
MRIRRTVPAALVAFCLLATPAAGQAPKAVKLSSGWETRGEAAAPAPEQGPPPIETEPEAPTPPAAAGAAAWTAPLGQASQTTDWRPVSIPSVFDPRALPSLYPGSVRSYRVSFTPPVAPKGFSWRIEFEEVRRKATVYLNGRRIGGNDDPYTPFAVDARGLRPGVPNLLRVVVDSRKNPRLPEAWWNWGGIVRPVHLVPVGRAHIRDLGTMSQVECSGPAQGCTASLLIEGVLEHEGPKPTKPKLEVRLRAPGGRVTTKRFNLPRQTAAKQPLRLSVPVPAPELWAPESPKLYAASITLRDGGQVQQVEHRQVGLRSVTVRGGKLLLNNRAIQLRGASIHEDMPGHGAALTPRDMDAIVAQLKELGANVTRSHYVLTDALLARLDRAGIMVWNEAPIWQRDRHANVLRLPKNQQRAWETVRRTVIAGRSHPSVITHSVANELWSRPDQRPNITKRYLLTAQEEARKLDPTLPISVDINGRPGHPEQFTYHAFDMIGINQYYGWYRWVANFDELPLFLQEMRDNYPDKALVMTEWGAEGREEWADEPVTKKGGYAFQAMHAARTLDVLDHAPLSGGIYWTLREFAINPGWQGGAGKRPAPFWPNTMHQKGLLTYDGAKKPVWQIVHDRYVATPLYEQP